MIEMIVVGKTTINHPPVITSFIGGMVTIPSHGWFMTKPFVSMGYGFHSELLDYWRIYPILIPLLTTIQWEFQDPNMEVLYHISGHILWGYSLTFWPDIYRPYIIGTSVLNRFLSHGH